MYSFLVEVGNNIRLYRKAASLTQENLGEILSIDPSYIGKIERGEANTTLETLLKIAEALHISPFELFQTSSKHENSENQDIIEKINIMLLNLQINDLKTVSRILKDITSLVKK